MKIIYTLLASSLLFFTASSQPLKFSANYNLDLPQCDMGKNIQAAHGMQVGLLYQLPGALKKFSVGLEAGGGSYAHKQIDQTFKFDNNTSTVVPVNYNSNIYNASLQTRYNVLDDKKFKVVPYINAKGGLYTFSSNINIEDPQDPDGCRALERKNIIKDKTLYWSAGGGVQINPAVFSKRPGKGRVLIDIGANIVRGGTLDYINTKNLKDGHNHNDMPQEGGKPMNVRFINASTQSIHEHSVAQVYTSSLKMMEFRTGVILVLGKGCCKKR
jgi:hypothetical protein